MLKHLTLCKKKNHICNQIFTLSEKIRVVVLSLLRCWYFLILRVVEVKAFVSFKKRHNDEVFRVDNILPALNYVVPQKKADKFSVTFPFGFSLLQIIHSIVYSQGLNIRKNGISDKYWRNLISINKVNSLRQHLSFLWRKNAF